MTFFQYLPTCYFSLYISFISSVSDDRALNVFDCADTHTAARFTPELRILKKKVTGNKEKGKIKSDFLPVLQA